jgi:tRNA nucleotidyltransferase/poly(A) polymerase
MSTRNPKREFALEVVERLRARGFEALFAGGCVRDQLLGVESKDYDVATNARPDEIREVFGRRKTLAIGAAFGVIAVVGPKPAGTVEVTTFRRDAEYSDGRHPDAVSFSTAEEDAQRRDFTINGLFFDPLAQRVIDYVGGVEDLGRHVVRAIGDPRARFREDKLRLLRAVRMAARFRFELDRDTFAAAREMAAQVTMVSAERIAQEMRAMLVLPERARAVELLAETGLLEAILPEALAMQGMPREGATLAAGDRWHFTLRVLAELASPTFSLALAALVEDLPGSPELIEQLGERWRLSNKETERARWLAEHHRALDAARQLKWSKLQRILICEGIDELLELHAARARADGRDASDLEYCREKLRLPGEELDPRPLVTGYDLIQHGVPQGPQYAALLEQVRDAQLDGEVATKEEALKLVDRLVAGA